MLLVFSAMAAQSATVVRIKRKLTDDPVAALVLSFKRARENESGESDDDTANRIFKFTGSAPIPNTVDGETSPTAVRQQLIQVFKSNLQDHTAQSQFRRYHKVHLADVRLKRRREKEVAVRQQRDHLLLSFRDIDMRDNAIGQGSVETTKEEFVEELPMPFVDVGQEYESGTSITASSSGIAVNGQPMIRVRQSSPIRGGDQSDKQKKDYVYDYYMSSFFCDARNNDESVIANFTNEKRKRTSTTSSNEGNDVSSYFDNLIGVYPYNLFDEAVDHEADNVNVHFDGMDEEDDDDDDADSNAETNLRNEYPDEDDDFENRYEFYDQNDGSDQEEEEEEFTGDGVSFLDQMRDLELGGGGEIDY